MLGGHDTRVAGSSPQKYTTHCLLGEAAASLVDLGGYSQKDLLGRRQNGWGSVPWGSVR